MLSNLHHITFNQRIPIVKTLETRCRIYSKLETRFFLTIYSPYIRNAICICFACYSWSWNEISDMRIFIEIYIEMKIIENVISPILRIIFSNRDFKINSNSKLRMYLQITIRNYDFKTKITYDVMSPIIQYRSIALL